MSKPKPSEIRASVIAQRDKLMLGYIQQKLSLSDIGGRLGLEDAYVYRLRSQMAKDHGLSTSDGISEERPYGLTDQSKPFRVALGNALYDETLKPEAHPVKIAYTIGVSQKSQPKAWGKGGFYNWKLSEIERLAAARGQTFIQFMREMLSL